MFASNDQPSNIHSSPWDKMKYGSEGNGDLFDNPSSADQIPSSFEGLNFNIDPNQGPANGN